MDEYRKFMDASSRPRVIEYPMPVFENEWKDASPFPPDEKPIFVFHSLPGRLYGAIKLRKERREALTSMAGSIAGAISGDTEAAKEAKKKIDEELAPEVSPEFRARIEFFIEALVFPEIPHDERRQFAAKLHENFPVDLQNMGHLIIQATGEGWLPGELKSSTETPKSGAPSA